MHLVKTDGLKERHSTQRRRPPSRHQWSESPRINFQSDLQEESRRGIWAAGLGLAVAGDPSSARRGACPFSTVSSSLARTEGRSWGSGGAGSRPRAISAARGADRPVADRPL